ncbi:MAG: hypothetical protein V7760_02675 [Marinobacter sp.]
MSSVVKTTKALTQAPLPDIVEKLGLAIAGAQYALDINSASLAKTMAETDVEIGGKKYNLLSLGFTPTFYAFTEATVEAKLSYTMSEGTTLGGSLEVSASGGVPFFMAAATVSASYERKFSVSAEGASSIAAKLVSLPPPERFMEVLRATIPSLPTLANP